MTFQVSSSQRARHETHDLIQERLRVLHQHRELASASNLTHMEPLYNQEIQDTLRLSGALRHREERMELRNRANRATIHNDAANNSENPDSATTHQNRRESIRLSERNAAERMNAAENAREEVSY